MHFIVSGRVGSGASIKMPDTPYLTVLIPAYNEQAGIATTIQAISTELGQLALDYKILIVDDGSRDRTTSIVGQIAQVDLRVRLARHPRNLGIGAGIHTGIREARRQFMVFVPADLAMRPDQLRCYVDASRQADLVLGNRSDRRDYTWFRKLVSASNIFLIRSLFRLKRHQFAYINLYRVSILRQIRIETRGVFISHELIIKARDLGAVIEEVQIDYVPRQTGQATGARLSFVIHATLETLGSWCKWAYCALTHRRTPSYLATDSSPKGLA
jgi:glycosyltransferase involved in cell wall biosynthesis